MADERSGSRQVSYEQMKLMIDFMSQNSDFATGSLRTLEARYTSKKLWAKLADLLNDCEAGTSKTKTADGWSKYWSDFKNKLKNKVIVLKKQKCGKSLNKIVKPLTKLEKRALVILGPNFDKKLKTEIFDKNDIILLEVKQEDYEENMDYCSNTQNDTIDRLSGAERESDESGQSSLCEYEENADLNSSEQFAHNLYPKWLVEVEKKRADAELLRAKAEENRARASTKSAEAALIQAEALKKLADAATAQANAVMRIATMLENRGHTDDVL